MLDSILRWLAGQFGFELIKFSDPQLASKVEAARAQAKELNAEFQQLTEDIKARTVSNAGAQKEIEALKRDRETVETVIADEQAKLAQRKADRDRLSDIEKLHLPV